MNTRHLPRGGAAADARLRGTGTLERNHFADGLRGLAFATRFLLLMLSLLGVFWASPAAAAFPCSVGPADMPSLAFQNAGDGSFQNIGLSASAVASSSTCGSVPLLRPRGVATLNSPQSTTAGGYVQRTSSTTVTYKPPSPTYSGTDQFDLDNGNSANTIVVTVVISGGTPTPKVTALSPTTGPAAGGTSVTITGTDLNGATGVMFGSTAATSFTVNSATQITATAPAGSGTVNVTVTTPGGTSATGSGTAYTYVAVPTVTAVSPTSGPAAGGNTVILSGTNFSGTTSVMFGSTAATSFIVNSATQITATAPAGTGAVNITVTTTGGTSATGAGNAYTYVAAPTISSLSPTSGPTGGGTSVTISGANFTGATSVLFGGIAATGFTVTSANSIVATAPAGTGTVNVTVTTSAGTSAGTAFTYVALPTVTSLSPTSGPTAGGTSVVITGTGFSGTTSVLFGATSAVSFTVNSATQITAIAPSGSGAVNVTVTNAGGTSATSAGSVYTFVAAPVASAKSATVAYQTATAIDLSSSISGAHTSIAIGTAAAHGTTSVSGDVVTYTPAAGYSGPDSFTYTATGTGGTSAPATVSITVTPPTITVSPGAGSLPAGTQGMAYSQTFTASGGAAPYTFTMSAGALPSGLSLSTSGVLSGTPTANGTFNFSIKATDAGSAAGTASYTLTVAVAAPVAGNASATVAANSSGNAVTLNLSGGAATSVAIGTQAAHGTATASGTSITYTPTAGYSGADTFTYTATNGSGTSSPGTVTITVSPPTLTIAPTTLPAATANTPYNQTLSTANGTSPYTYALSGVLPPGMTFVSTGTLSGTPTASGTFNITVTSTDAYGATGSRAYTLSVTIGAPVANAGNATVASNSSANPIPLNITGGAATSVAVGTQAAHGTATASGTSITYTPTAGYAGPDTFTYTASNGSGTSAPATISITVNGPTIVVSPASVPNGTVGAAYSVALTASGGTAPYTYQVSAGGLPAGLALSSGGVLSGTPTAGGTFNFSVRAVDSSSGTGPFQATRAYTLTVGVPTIVFAPASGALPNGTVGAAYAANVAASGGTAPYVYGSTGLPAGLAINASTGAISGTPTTAGTSNVTVNATDAHGALGSTSYTIVIGVQTPVAGATSATVAANSNANAITLALSGGAASSVAVATPAAHGTATASGTAITYTPLAGYSGTDSFTYTATNGAGTSAPATVTLTVSAPTLVLTLATLPAATQGVAYSQTLTASGGTAPYGFVVSAGALPSGLTLAANGNLTGTPTAAGSFAFTLTVTDALGATGSRAYTLSTAIAAPVAGPVNSTVAANSATNAITPNITGGAAASVAIAAQPGHGTATASGLTITYTPTTGFSGTDRFTYTATNASGTSQPATVTITVQAPAFVFAPAAGTLPAATVGSPFTQTIVATNGVAPYQFGSATLPPGLALSTAGVLSGTPTTGGSFTIVVTATDANGATSSATYALGITVPAPPVAQNSGATTVAASTIAVRTSSTINLSDLVTGDYTSIAIVSQPAHGTVVLSTATASAQRVSAKAVSGTPPAQQTIAVYTPTPGYRGPDSFQYAATGPGGASSPATVNLNVIAAQPTAVDLNASTSDNQTVTVDLTTGVDGSPFTAATIVGIAPVDAARAVLVAGGDATNRTYRLDVTPRARFDGTLVVRYTLSNGFGTSSPASVTVTVKARPDPSSDAVVRGISDAQVETTRRFSQTQVDNFMRRTEALHHGGGRLDLGVTVQPVSPTRTVRGQTPVDENGPVAPDAKRIDRTGGGGDVSDVPERERGPVGVWTGGTIQVGGQDATAQRSKISATTSGLSAGVDVRVRPGLVVGFGAGYGSDRSDIASGAGRVSSDNRTVALYASAMPTRDLFVDGFVGHGWLSFDTRRDVTANGMVATGNRDGTFTAGSVAVGIDRLVDQWRWATYARGTVLSASLDAYQESGAGMYDLRFDHRRVRSTSGTLGFRVAFVQPLSVGTLTARVRGEWQHEFQRVSDQTLDYADVGGGSFYAIGTRGWSREQFLLAPSVSLDLRPDWRIDLETGVNGGSGRLNSVTRVQVSKQF